MGDAAPGDPSINGITPSTVYLERVVDVVISGFGTEFSAPTVDFGAGITVDAVDVASGTGLFASITISDTAALGFRDVTVSDGGVDYVYTDAFYVEAPLAFTTLIGDTNQGGIGLARIDMLDPDTPFDSSVDGALTDLFIAGGLAAPVEVTPFSIDAFFFIDASATPGMSEALTDSVSVGFLTTSRNPEAFDLTARAATALTPGTPITAAIGADYATQLYQVDVAADMIATITVSSDTVDPDAGGAFSILNGSGQWVESPAGGALFSFDSSGGTFDVISDNDGETYYVVVANLGETGFDVTIDAAERATNDVEPNNDCANAQVIDVGGGFPAGETDLGLTSTSDEDWFSVTVDASAVDSSFLVSTLPGDAGTDTVVEVFSGACAALTSMGVSSDVDFHDSVNTSAITAAGTYYIKVSHSQIALANGMIYDLDVDLGVPALPPIEEVEPNDTSGEADTNNTYSGLTSFGDEVVFHGELPGASFDGDLGDFVGEIDFWAVAIPDGAWVYAETQTTDWYRCDDFTLDSFLTFYATDGSTIIATNDDIDFFGGNACSAIDETNGGGGFTAGTYYFAVEAYSPIDYNLYVTAY